MYNRSDIVVRVYLRLSDLMIIHIYNMFNLEANVAYNLSQYIIGTKASTIGTMSEILAYKWS